MSNDNMRRLIVDILVATRGMSEGHTADAIISALSPWPNRDRPWTELSACLYQACGAYDLPERILDVLALAQAGKPFGHLIEGLLPCCPQPENTRDQVMGRVHHGEPGTLIHGGVYACLNSVGRRLPDGAPLYHISPKPTALPEGWRITRHQNGEIQVDAPGDHHCCLRFIEKAPLHLPTNMFYELCRQLIRATFRESELSPMGKRQWINMADQEPENDSIVWTRWTGMPETEGRAPVTGEAAKSLTPYVRSLQWLDTDLRRPAPPETGGADAG